MIHFILAIFLTYAAYRSYKELERMITINDLSKYSIPDAATIGIVSGGLTVGAFYELILSLT